MITDIKVILKEWAYRVDNGKPNPKNGSHIYHLKEILIENKWPFSVIDELLYNLTEVDIVKNKDSGNVYTVQTHNPNTQDLIKKNASDDEIEKVKQDKADARTSEPISGINDIQTDLENKRDKGVAGAGGPVASQGESRYCNAMNNHDDDNFKKENRELIDKKKEEIKNRKLKAKEKNDLEALGLEGDEALEYLATRETFADKELERIKKDKDSVFYKKGKTGFNGRDEDYKEWMRAAYDGTLSTRKILNEDTDMDMSKPNTTIQSEPEVDDKVETEIQKKLDEAETDEDKKYYQKELDDFKKFRKYHDTYTVGQDNKGRLHVVSISNKKGSDLKDPQNNTTPRKRFEIIKDNYGDDVAETVTNSLNEGIERVSDTKQSAVKRGSKLNIDESISSICETKQMQKYMDKLDGNAKFREFVEKQGKDYDKLSTKEKLQLMQQHADELIKDGRKPAYEPYGKIWTKIGEFSRTKNFREKNPDINYESESIQTSIQIKQDEKDAVNSSHTNVVNEITNADEEDGFPKDGVNGPHTQGYISTVMKAMHFDSYIDGGDKKMIIQMGIRGAKPNQIRECLAEQSGFDGDLKTTEGRDGLKKHLREKCRIDAKSGAIFVESPDGERQIAEDTWRTAGTSQKVASGFGKEMRDCIKGKVDKDRKK